MSELTRLLEARLKGPEEVFVHDKGRWYTTSDFERDVNRVFGTLQDSGVEPGQRVVVSYGNSYAFATVYVALLRFGATVVPLNPAMPLPELDKVFGRAQPVGAFVNEDKAQHLLASGMHSSLRFVGQIQEPFVHVNGDSASDAAMGDGARTVDVILYKIRNGAWVPVPHDEANVVETVPEPPEGTPAILLFTSGTTGTPKGVALTHRQVMATSRNVSKAHQLSPQDVTYCFLPLFHINAQVIALVSTLLTRGKLVIDEKFSASRFWDMVNEFGVTWVSAVPAVIAILNRATDPKKITPTLRFVRSASAPLPAFDAHRFEAKFGVPVIESYGLTEAASQVCINPLPPGKRKIGSVGLPTGVELKVVDEEGNIVERGEIGEIVIRGEAVITSYAYGDGASSFTDGWFFTGDLGYQDEEGYVFITGRSKEMINRGGQKVSPREVEEVIGQHAGVKSVAVIGLPDEVHGERVVAYVIRDVENPARHLDEEILKTELQTLCKSSISAYKCPAEYYFVEEIPVGPTGKIQRHRLKQQVLAVEAGG